MKNIYKNIIKNILVIVVVLFSTVSISVPAYAQLTNAKNYACNGAGLDANACTGGGGGGISQLLTTILNTLSWVVGVVAVIMIIIAGFRYIVSGGDEAGVRGAKNAILYVVVGIVIVVLAQIIVQFVLKKSTGV